MAGLQSLIRLHKYQVDEKRRILGEKIRVLDALTLGLARLREQHEAEKKSAAASDEVSFTLGNYVAHFKSMVERFQKEIAQAEREVQQAKDVLLDGYAELKKFEMTEAERARIEEDERKLREAKTFDEIGLEIFRRSESES